MPPQTGKIQHVVVIFQENRATDNLFQDPVLIKRGAEIAQSGTDSKGNTIPLKEVDLAVDYDPGHCHPSFVKMCDMNSTTGQCQMNGADLIEDACNAGATDCPAPDLSFGHVNRNEVQPYFQLAEQYTFADRMFQTNQGPSFRRTSSSFPGHRLHLPRAICLLRRIRLRAPGVTLPRHPWLS